MSSHGVARTWGENPTPCFCTTRMHTQNAHTSLQADQSPHSLQRIMGHGDVSPRHTACDNLVPDSKFSEALFLPDDLSCKCMFCCLPSMRQQFS